MCFYKYFAFGYLFFLVLVACVENIKQHKINKKPLNSELKIFKNITEANETLQKLIKNYKHLEKIYQSDETKDRDSSESEIDEVIRQISSEKLLQKQTFTTNYPTTYYRGTAHIYEYQVSSEIGGEDVKDEKEELGNAKEEKTSEEASLENDVKIITSSEKTSGSDEITPKIKSGDIMEIKMESPEKIESIIYESKTSFIKNKPQEHPNNSFQKTRFSVLQSGKDKINDKKNKSEIPFKIGNQRIVYSEQFSPETIWHEIISRPIKLNRVISSEESSKSSNNKEDSIKRLDEFETQQELSNIATDQHSIPRNSYGSECVRVPIKKCKKAMKAVNKNVCKIKFKCKSDFKSDFVENSKQECVKKFSYTYSVSKESNLNISREKKDDNQFPDATRYRHLHMNVSTKETVLSLGSKNRNSSIQFSLRDKYEKRCQKESREKCIDACNDSIEKTCLKHTCDKKKKKALKKSCKKECKNIFVIDNKSSESSDGDSSDEDNSDSDSD